jgi:PEP-CTERM motif
MNFKQASALIGLMAGSTLALSSAPAQAFNFTTSGGCAAAASSGVTADGFTLVAGGGSLACKTVVDTSAADDGYVGPVTGIGITSTNDSTSGEIGPKPTEFMELILPGSGGILGSLDLSFLYRPQVFHDAVFEVAAALPDTSPIEGTLKILGPSSAVWTWGTITQNLTAISNSTDGTVGTNKGGGWYSVQNPFGDLSLSKIKLRAVVQPGAEVNYKNTDFALVGATLKDVEKVPEPTTLAGLGVIGGLIVASRRRRKASQVS